MALNTNEILNTYENLEIETKYDHIYKIIIIGDSSVGKTALLSKYLRGVFPSSPLPTVATEFATKMIQIKEGGFIKAQIWDTAGQEKYKSITYHHYKKSVGALILYDITKRSTFDSIQKWHTDLTVQAEIGCITALIGNKLDLIEKNDKLREVSKEEAETYAKNNNMLFYETSALNGNNINDIFEDLIQAIYTEKRKIPYLNNIVGNKQNINIRTSKNKHLNIENECGC